MRELQRFTEEPRACSYLEGAVAALEHRVALEVGSEELEALLVRGWRRFGPVYFRPACAACNACVSLRVPVARFQPTRSQRRAERGMAGFRLESGPPRVDGARLALHAEWHRERELARDWPPSPLDARDYFVQLAFPHPAALELTRWDGDRLVSVGLADVTPHGVSAVYAFHDPAVASLSPGIANVLTCIDIARQRGAEHVYLGYRVSGCPSLEYKGLFRPHETLRGRPSEEDVPDWREAPAQVAGAPA